MEIRRKRNFEKNLDKTPTCQCLNPLAPNPRKQILLEPQVEFPSPSHTPGSWRPELWFTSTQPMQGNAVETPAKFLPVDRAHGSWRPGQRFTNARCTWEMIGFKPSTLRVYCSRPGLWKPLWSKLHSSLAPSPAQLKERVFKSSGFECFSLNMTYGAISNQPIRAQHPFVSQ